MRPNTPILFDAEREATFSLINLIRIRKFKHTFTKTYNLFSLFSIENETKLEYLRCVLIIG